MINLVRIEALKLRTAPALFVAALVTVGLALVAGVSNVLLAGRNGSAALGSHDNVTKVFNQPAAISCMAMFILGVIVIAGEYKQRTIVSTYLAEPRRGRTLIAKLITTALVGALVSAVAFGLTYAAALVAYSTKGVHHLDVDVAALWSGTTVGGACFGMLGVALGALTRNTIGAVIAGLVWIQVVEVALLESAVPALGKWLPTGAAVALTTTDRSAHLLAPAVAVLVLVAWTALLATVATRVSARREVH
jgi:ABC-type transport system involved in multi-copper enzyme maturation permease subunit